MPATDFDAERSYNDDKFTLQEIYHNERVKVGLGYFEPGQFIPVHAPGSDLILTVKNGAGLVRDGDVDRELEPGDVVVVPADTDRGIRAAPDACLEVLVVVTPPPTDTEHEPVRRGLQTNDFEPTTDR